MAEQGLDHPDVGERGGQDAVPIFSPSIAQLYRSSAEHILQG